MELPDAHKWYRHDFGSPIIKSQTLYTNSVACFSGGEKGQGHVIFIEEAYSDGSFEYSEGNCGIHTEGKTYSASSVRDYIKGHKYRNHPEWDFEYKGCIFIKGAPNVGA